MFTFLTESFFRGLVYCTYKDLRLYSDAFPSVFSSSTVDPLCIVHLFIRAFSMCLVMYFLSIHVECIDWNSAATCLLKIVCRQCLWLQYL